jgi:hypothetical protein
MIWHLVHGLHVKNLLLADLSDTSKAVVGTSVQGYASAWGCR